MADYTLSAKGTYDGSNFDKGIGRSCQALESFSSRATSAVSGIVKAVASLEAVKAVASFAGAALDSYAQYEQLVGGIDTLFKDSSGKLQQYADNAYKTAGMSANAYMDTATSFSASLIQSLGGDTAKAVEYANMAITDMSDNANKMGTDISMIQTAYQGFAKQQYNLLDNLKLGYGGTKEEMQRLLDDATKLSGIKYDISSYADVVDAIHVIQTEMGIAGATAAEAAETVDGSVSSMKAAWQNWVTGLANEDADLNALTTQLVDSVTIAASNVLPRIGQIFASMGTVIASNLMNVRNAIPELFAYISSTITTTLGSIAAGLPQVIDDSVSLLTRLGNSVLGLVPKILPSVIKAGIALFQGLVQAIPTAVTGTMNALNSVVTQVAQMLPKLLPMIQQAAIYLFKGLVNAIPLVLPALISGAMGAVNTIVMLLPTMVPMLLESAITLFQTLADSLPEVLPKLIDAVTAAVGQVGNYIPTLVPMIFSAAGTLFAGIVSAVPTILGSLLTALDELMSKVPDKITSFVDSIKQAGRDLIAGMVSGITDAAGEVWDAITNVCSQAEQKIRDFFGIASPSKVTRRLFNFVGDGMALGLSDKASSVVRTMSGIASSVTEAATVEIGAPSFATAGYAGGVSYRMNRARSEGGGTVVNNYYSVGSVDYAGDAQVERAVFNLFNALERKGSM